ncbi:MAG: peptidylprolyl isomerase [Erysipelotrichaceae bacterium]|nr:peptidylprolyl isomerase [Erysipelotrichaceae bacterium]
MKYIKILFVLVLLLNIAGCSKKEEKKEETKEENITETSGPIYCEITVKDYGTMKLELYPDIAPLTVENFVKLVKDGFYTDNRFHRIIDGFMIQGGMDTTGSVERIKGEFLSNGIVNDLKHTEGVISMARAKDPDSASSQFFIMVGDGSWLDGEYAAFGKVIEGYEVALQIAKDAKPIDNNGSIAQEDMPVIESIVIVEK